MPRRKHHHDDDDYEPATFQGQLQQQPRSWFGGKAQAHAPASPEVPASLPLPPTPVCVPSPPTIPSFMTGPIQQRRDGCHKSITAHPAIPSIC
jgi:hypothetical protein